MKQFVSLVGGLFFSGLALAQVEVCLETPKENVDSTPLENLYKITLFWGTQSKDYKEALIIPTSRPGNSTCTYLNLPEGDWFIAATATNLEGEVSAFSNEVKKTVPPENALKPYIAKYPSCDACISQNASVLIAKTGQTVPIEWVSNNPVEVEILEYPASENAVPVNRAVFSETESLWEWTPTRAGLFFSRVRSCLQNSCQEWQNSYEQGFLFAIELSAPTGGGIN